MQYTASKDVSRDGSITRHYVASPAGDMVCSTHTERAATLLAAILNTHGGTILGTPIMHWDWAALNGKRDAAA